MINKKCFTLEWIQEQAQNNNCKSLILLEKAIIALQLLAYLAESSIPFQFKGGTSLLLRFNPLKRLSIDIDIVTQATEADLEAVIEKICKLTPFEGFYIDDRPSHDSTPKKHYKFLYTSQVYPQNRKDNLLLDVIFDTKGLPKYDSLIINTPFIIPDREIQVSVPTLNSLLGEKLTAFAPSTIGIKYNEDRKTEIIKQLFDIGVLFDVITDLSEVKEAYNFTFSRQNVYRDTNYTLEQTLMDSIQAGFELSRFDPGKNINTENGQLLKDGVASLSNFLLKHKFTLDEAKIAASKMACICAWILSSPHIVNIAQIRYQSKHINELRTLFLADTWKDLNSIKKINPEAFYYWFQAQQMITKLSNA